jgi:hypothetical protein
VRLAKRRELTAPGVRPSPSPCGGEELQARPSVLEIWARPAAAESPGPREFLQLGPSRALPDQAAPIPARALAAATRRRWPRACVGTIRVVRIHARSSRASPRNESRTSYSATTPLFPTELGGKPRRRPRGRRHHRQWGLRCRRRQDLHRAPLPQHQELRRSSSPGRTGGHPRRPLSRRLPGRRGRGAEANHRDRQPRGPNLRGRPPASSLHGIAPPALVPRESPRAATR